ncbi:MAG: efflux RND transporter periplasmic adaptor subunit [Capsulimonadaceae bacterium]
MSDNNSVSVANRNKPGGTAAEGSSRVARSITAAMIVLGIGALVALRGHGESKAPDSAQVASSDVITVSDVGQSVAQIRTEPVQLEALDSKVAATGLLSYPANSTVKIAPRVTGRISSVYVQVGDHVSAGQPVAVIDSPDAAAAGSTLKQNQANLRLAQATLDRAERQFQLGTPEVTAAQATLDQAKSNEAFSKAAFDKIKEQSQIGGFSQQPLEAANDAVVTDQSSLIQSQADLDTAQRAYDRMVKLVAIGVNSQSDLDAAQNTLAHAKASVDANQKVLNLASEALGREQKAFDANLYSDQALITAEGNYRQSILQVDADTRALAIAKASILADLQQAQNGYQNAVAAVSSAQAALNLLGISSQSGSVTITSPISGVVVERDVNPGQMVDQSQMTPWQLLVVSNTARVWVTADVYESDLAAVHPGQPVSIKVDAYPYRVFTGTVVRVAPTLNPQTRAVSVRAEIPNESGLLKDGMFAEMTILTGKSDREPVIPIDAVQHDADTDYVYIRKGSGYARQNVRVGDEKNGECAITAGLQPGDHVVTQGALLLGGQVESD